MWGHESNFSGILSSWAWGTFCGKCRLNAFSKQNSAVREVVPFWRFGLKRCVRGVKRFVLFGWTEANLEPMQCSLYVWQRVTVHLEQGLRKGRQRTNAVLWCIFLKSLIHRFQIQFYLWLEHSLWAPANYKSRSVTVCLSVGRSVLVLQSGWMPQMSDSCTAKIAAPRLKTG